MDSCSIEDEADLELGTEDLQLAACYCCSTCHGKGIRSCSGSTQTQHASARALHCLTNGSSNGPSLPDQ